MKAASTKHEGSDREPRQQPGKPDRTKQTPATDLQDDDAGTAASRDEGPNPAQRAMKQTSKTKPERGDKR